MEVAGQWRREWAGTAEYGKVTEGGVTRRIARAMEVLHASGPGARVRVMRAAYHSTAGPGAPASSYLLHSSRRVISSGYDFREPSSLPSKPLEISSTPLESSPEVDMEKTNYKVTEPDDLEISEPSKWRGAVSKSSIRMPSEESSSTDNASIIDLDSKISKPSYRKSMFENEGEDKKYEKNNRVSPILDSPVSLSTLKYTSILNGSDEWNARRKSYSFEDTSPMNTKILHTNDPITMESSTDSGICKSSEIVNEHACSDNIKPEELSHKSHLPEETFKDWLSKNRFISDKITHSKPFKENHFPKSNDNNVVLQSPGKVSITLPITIERDDALTKSQLKEENDRKTKKVEFCKTELHFAAETGTVNIIATDEKPPPTNDFRKRRSAFVPLTDKLESKSITLFSEKSDSLNVNSSVTTNYNKDFVELDENTAATKSILKNKIPKPKPYLLGENMEFGASDGIKNIEDNHFSTPTAVSLINKQLQYERRGSRETTSSVTSEIDSDSLQSNIFRKTDKDPYRYSSPHVIRKKYDEEQGDFKNNGTSNSIKNKVKNLHLSPTPARSKTRELRESDLTYFGIGKEEENTKYRSPKSFTENISDQNDLKEEIFHSVRLVQQISNSVCNSEAESDDGPEYQNIYVKRNFAPLPAPRTRTTFGDMNSSKVLKPISEKENETMITPDIRRSRLRQSEQPTPKSRSRSEPPKVYKLQKEEHKHRKHNVAPEISQSRRNEVQVINNTKSATKSKKSSSKHVNNKITDDSTPLYVNLSQKTEMILPVEQSVNQIKLGHRRSQSRSESDTHRKENSTPNNQSIEYNRKHDENITVNKTEIERDNNYSQNSQNCLRKKIRRTEKLATPEHSIHTNNDERRIKSKRHTDSSPHTTKNEHRTRTSRRCESKSEATPHTDKKYDVDNNAMQIKSQKRHNSSNRIKDTREVSSKLNKSLTNAYRDDRNFSALTRERDLSPFKHNRSERDPEKKHYSERKCDSERKHDSEKNHESEKNHRRSKRSEYVINYDDKNGTVSSVCKIKPGVTSSATKRNKIPTDNKENSKDNVIIKSRLNKIALRK